jgi:hypothetical protein
LIYWIYPDTVERSELDLVLGIFYS